jgi:hypothetical protein
MIIYITIVDSQGVYRNVRSAMRAANGLVEARLPGQWSPRYNTVPIPINVDFHAAALRQLEPRRLFAWSSLPSLSLN